MAYKDNYKDVRTWSKQFEHEVLHAPSPCLGNRQVGTRTTTRELAGKVMKGRFAKETSRSHKLDNEAKPSIDEVRKRLGLKEER